MRTVEYQKRFDDGNRSRVEFTTERGKILKFAVQLECYFAGRWHPVLRYDTAHGFAHRDILRPKKDAIKEKLDLPGYDEALTFAIDDLNRNWLQYRRRYQAWLTEKQR